MGVEQGKRMQVSQLVVSFEKINTLKSGDTSDLKGTREINLKYKLISLTFNINLNIKKN